MRRQRPVLLVAGAVACLAACGGPLTVEAPAPTAVCKELLADLPAQVGDQQRRDVEGDRAAAYGDPAILLRCGVGRPDELTTNCNTVEGVDWYSREEDDGLRVFTVGREPVVEVWIPSRYGMSAAPLVDVAEAVKEHTESRSPCPGASASQ